MENNRSKNSLKNAVFATIESICATIFPFFLRFALLKILGEKYLGLNNLFHSILNVLSLAEVGFGQAISFSMYKPLAQKDDDKVCSLMALYRKIYLIIGTFIMITGISLIPFLDLLVKNDYPRDINITIVYLIYLSQTVISYLFFAHRVALLNAAQLAYRIKQINLITSFISFGIRLAVLYLFQNYYLFIIFIPFISLINNLFSALLSFKLFPEYRCYGEVDKDSLHKIIDMVKDICIHRFGGVIVSSLGSIVISAYLGLSAVAVYGNYNYVVSSLLGIGTVCLASITANIGNSIAEQSKEKNYGLFKEFNLINRFLALVFTVCLFCLYSDFMNAWQGENLTLGVECNFVFSLLFFIYEMRKSVEIFKSACGIWKADRLKPLISGIINIILNLLLINKLGIITPVLATILCFIIIEIPWETAALFRVYFNSSSREYYFHFIKNSILTSICTGFCYYLCSFIHLPYIMSFIVKGVLCFLLASLYFFILNRKEKEFTSLINRFSFLRTP